MNKPQRHPTQPNPIPAKRVGSARFAPAMLAAVVAAFVAGRMTAGPPSAPPEADTGYAEDQQTAPRTTSDGTPARILERLRSTGGGDPGMAPSASAAQALAALDRLDRMPSSEQREDERLRIIEQWATVAPEPAMDYVRRNLKGDRQSQAMAKVVKTWAKHAPAAAWQWARKQGPSGTYQAHTVMEEIARNDPATAAKLAADFARQEPQEAVAMALTAIRGMTFDGNFESARHFTADLHLASPEDQASLCNYLGGQWARHDPEPAAAWARALPEGPQRDQALLGLGESWAEVDPARAATFAEQLPPGQTRQIALQQAVGHWSLGDPAAANEWMSHLAPSPDLDQAVATLATERNMMQQHVELALNWASAVSDPSLRLSSLRTVVSDWALRDHDAALGYLQTSPRLSAETRDALLAQIAR